MLLPYLCPCKKNTFLVLTSLFSEPFSPNLAKPFQPTTTQNTAEPNHFETPLFQPPNSTPKKLSQRRFATKFDRKIICPITDFLTKFDQKKLSHHQFLIKFDPPQKFSHRWFVTKSDPKTNCSIKKLSYHQFLTKFDLPKILSSLISYQIWVRIEFLETYWDWVRDWLFENFRDWVRIEFLETDWDWVRDWLFEKR